MSLEPVGSAASFTTRLPAITIACLMAGVDTAWGHETAAQNYETLVKLESAWGNADGALSPEDIPTMQAALNTLCEKLPNQGVCQPLLASAKVLQHDLALLSHRMTPGSGLVLNSGQATQKAGGSQKAFDPGTLTPLNEKNTEPASNEVGETLAAQLKSYEKAKDNPIAKNTAFAQFMLEFGKEHFSGKEPKDWVFDEHTTREAIVEFNNQVIQKNLACQKGPRSWFNWLDFSNNLDKGTVKATTSDIEAFLTTVGPLDVSDGKANTVASGKDIGVLLRCVNASKTPAEEAHSASSPNIADTDPLTAHMLANYKNTKFHYEPTPPGYPGDGYGNPDLLRGTIYPYKY